VGFEKVDDEFFRFEIVFSDEIVLSLFRGDGKMSAKPLPERLSCEESGFNRDQGEMRKRFFFQGSING
jgi:hypothetical protein